MNSRLTCVVSLRAKSSCDLLWNEPQLYNGLDSEPL